MHYVCPVCGGVSNIPKECDTNGCKLEHQPLAQCNCFDDRHEEILSSGVHQAEV